MVSENEGSVTEAVDLTAVKNLRRNAWNWNLADFCERMGWQEDTYSKAKFLAFREVAQGIAQFDTEKLEILCAPTPKSEAVNA